VSQYLKDMFIEVRDRTDFKDQLETLTEMIEEVMDIELPEATPISESERFSMNIPIPKLTPNESWGDPNSQSRKDIERVFASITRQPSVKARIEHVNSFVDPALARRKGRGMRFNAILNMMMIIESLQACLNDYSESNVSAFLSALNETGKVFMSPTFYRGKRGIRAAFVNWRTTSEDISSVIELMQKINKKIS